MAYTKTNSSHTAPRTSGFGVVAWARATLDDMKEAARLRAIYVKTLTELDGMSNRDLADINISRHQIRDIAREAAYGQT